MSGKVKVGMYWAGSCGGCDISLLEIGPRLLDLIEVAEVVFWPCAADFKYRDVAGYPEGHIDVCFFNGSIRNGEHEEVARLLRRKSKTLVAYGACAMDGGIPALGNLFGTDELLEASYIGNASTPNPEGRLPRPRTSTPNGDVTIPAFYDQVLRLQDVVEVDYLLPGCPPQADRVWEAVQALASGSVPARNDAVRVGCGEKSVCDECPREKRLVKVRRFLRPYEARPEPGWCLLEQGFICMGPATRSGCRALCVNADMPCRGCYGPTGNAVDQGTAMVGALGSILAATTEAEAEEMIAQIADPVGTLYRFSLASSHLRGTARGRKGASS